MVEQDSSSLVLDKCVRRQSTENGTNGTLKHTRTYVQCGYGNSSKNTIGSHRYSQIWDALYFGRPFSPIAEDRLLEKNQKNPKIFVLVCPSFSCGTPWNGS